MSAFREMLAGGATTVARVWIVRRRDGLVLGFTDHDRDLMVEGVTCRASAGMTAGAVEAATGLSVDNGEVTGALSADALTPADIRAGRWDGAAVEARLVDWSAPERGEVLFRGSLGEIAESGGRFTAELRGLAEALNVTRGRVYHARCDAVLGDARCGVDLAAADMRLETFVTEVREEGRVLILDEGAGYADRWFERGRIAFLDGAAEGLEGRIKRDAGQGDGREVDLWTAPGAVPAPGDVVALEAGCDKLLGTCRDKFDNRLNFRGCPHLPGEDWLLAVPRAS